MVNHTWQHSHSQLFQLPLTFVTPPHLKIVQAHQAFPASTGDMDLANDQFLLAVLHANGKYASAILC
jgi:hypothetical protein